MTLKCVSLKFMNNTGYGNMLKEYFDAPIKYIRVITEIALVTLAKS